MKASSSTTPPRMWGSPPPYPSPAPLRLYSMMLAAWLGYVEEWDELSPAPMGPDDRHLHVLLAWGRGGGGG